MPVSGSVYFDDVSLIHEIQRECGDSLAWDCGEYFNFFEFIGENLNCSVNDISQDTINLYNFKSTSTQTFALSGQNISGDFKSCIDIFPRGSISSSSSSSSKASHSSSSSSSYSSSSRSSSSSSFSSSLSLSSSSLSLSSSYSSSSSLAGLNPVVEIVSNRFFSRLAWTPNYGGALGRFLGLKLAGGFTNSAYSDDGGYTWIDAPDIILQQYICNHLSFCNGKFMVCLEGLVSGGAGYGVAQSVDGINWTFGGWTIRESVTYQVVFQTEIAYHAPTGEFFASGIDTGRPLQERSVYTSSDGIYWHDYPGSSLPTLTTIHNGEFVGASLDNGVAVVVSWSYNWWNGTPYYHLFTCNTSPSLISWVERPYPSDAIPPPIYTSQIASNGTIIVYNNCYSYDGITWTKPQPFPNNTFAPDAGSIDYSSVSGVFANFNGSNMGGWRMRLSQNGMDWITVSLPDIGATYKDLAVGSDRVLASDSENKIIAVHLF